jgi:heterodisulfide reductase subunit C
MQGKNKSRRSLLNKKDPEKKIPESGIYPESVILEIRNLSKLVKPCLQCTTCASTCPVFQMDSARNPRRIIHRLALEEYENLFDEVDLWWCGGCYSCQVHCPQDVPLTRILYRLKNMLFELRKDVPSQIRLSGDRLKTGFILPLRKEAIETRKKLKLPDLLNPDLVEIESLLKHTGFVESGLK